MVKGSSAIRPKSSGAGDNTLVLVKIDDVDGIDVGTSEAVRRST